MKVKKHLLIKKLIFLFILSKALKLQRRTIILVQFVTTFKKWNKYKKTTYYNYLCVIRVAFTIKGAY